MTRDIQSYSCYGGALDICLRPACLVDFCKTVNIASLGTVDLYEFTGWGEQGGAWWRRRWLRSYLAPLSADNEKLRAFLAGYGWID